MITNNIVHQIVKDNPDLRDWSRYLTLGIYNPTTVAGYQHYISLAYERYMMPDFRDLRFFQADGTECNFWNESKTDGTSAAFWIKPENPSQKFLYAFYGNPEAVSRSNGDKTFEFFDDFEGGALDSNKWTQTNSPGSLTVTGGICSWTSAQTNVQRGISSVATFGQNTEAVIYLKAALGASPIQSYVWAGYGSVANASNEVSIYRFQQSGKNTGNTKNSGSSSTKQLSTGNDTSYFRFSLKRNGSTSVIFSDGVTTDSATTNVSAATTKIEIVSMTGTTSTTTYVDWVFVKKYTATEPTVIAISSGNKTR